MTMDEPVLETIMADDPGQARRALTRQIARLLEEFDQYDRTCCEPGRRLAHVTDFRGSRKEFKQSVVQAVKNLWKLPVDEDLRIFCATTSSLLDNIPRYTPNVTFSQGGEFYLDAKMASIRKEKEAEEKAHATGTCICGK